MRRLLHPLWIAAFIIVICSIGSIVSQPRQTVTQIDQGVYIDVQDASLWVFAPMWRDEIARRFPNAIGILCHGGDEVEGEWTTSANAYFHAVPVTKLVERDQRLYPGRPIVILACNTGHLRLNLGPNVYYSLSSVWCIPDRALKPGDLGADLALGPTTMPTTAPTLIDSPWDTLLPPVHTLLPKLIIVPPPPPTRWQRHPDWVGNIFEFVHD